MAELISLVMIVKNEAASIEATIASVRPFVDTYCIVDTGSTDGTPELIRNACATLPGALHHEPFVDFGATRSQALELAAERSVFTLMLSGDETLHQGEALRRFCETHRDYSGADHAAYMVDTRMGDSGMLTPRLARARMKMRYVGVTHEHLTRKGCIPPQYRVPEAFIFHDLAHCDPERKRRGYERDLELLRTHTERDPADTRGVFYLAQTYECLGRTQEAFSTYQRRLELGGWSEEQYQARYRMARLAAALDAPWNEVQGHYLAAHALAPQRAEPLYRIAQHWHGLGEYALAYVFGRRAAELPLPVDDALWVERSVYIHEASDLLGAVAFYVGEYAIGESATRRALSARPSDTRLLTNLAFYTARHRTEAA